jgi:signal transduction histidine kinase
LPALEFLAGGYRKRSGLEVAVEGPPGETRFPQEIETTLYRVVQEALNNVTRHAHAKHTHICLWTEDGVLCCSVKDDGTGFVAIAGDAGAAHTGLGLLGMHERVATLNGRFDVYSKPGQGTELRISIPIRSAT